MEGNNKGLMFAGLGLVILAIVVIGQFFIRGEDTAQPAPHQEPSTSAVIEDPEVGETPDQDTSDPADTDAPEAHESKAPSGLKVPGTAQHVASRAVVLYTEYSYKDAGPNAWIGRLAKISAPGFVHSLKETFGGDYEAEAYWDGEVVPTKRQTQTKIENVAIEEVFAKNTASKMTFTVTYRTSVHTTATNGWTDPPESLSQWVTVAKKGGRWVVTNIESTEDRS